MSYPLYDVPYLVRDPNDFRMSKQRHDLEVRNQAVVDDYFVARDKGLIAKETRRQVAEKHGMTPERVYRIVQLSHALFLYQSVWRTGNSY